MKFTLNHTGQLINYKTYEAFGETMLDTLGVTRQGYIGKEKDIENSLGDHGVRKYDYETGRFNSIDPLFEKYPGWSPYQYSMNNPIWAKDWNGKYFKFVDGKISDQDKSTFNNNLKTATFSIEGAKLVKQLSDAPYPIFIESMNNTGYIIGYGGAAIDSQGEVMYGSIVIDFNKSANILKTQLEELIHVQQRVNAPNRKEYQEKVTNEFKTKKYEDRFYEKDAKEKVNKIVNEIETKLKDLNSQPKVRNSQLPSNK